MAYSYIRYAGNGSTTNYVFSFPYISADHIQVRVNGVVTTLFSFLNSSTVQMTSAPASGAILEIRRVTPKDNAIVNFTDGSVLLERDLDLLAAFDLYLAQETKDSLDGSIQQDSLGVFDALNKRIGNVADPVNAQDAATKAWSETGMTAQLSQATAQAVASAASATAASGSASAAAASASGSATSASNAATSATGASTSATAASGSATAAANSATSAGISATNANTSALASAASASASATSAGNAATSATNAAGSAVSAASSAASAAALLDNFDDRYLGPKAADPAVDNDGAALVIGAIYFNNVSGRMKVYTSLGWVDSTSAAVVSLVIYEFVATAGQTTFSGVDAEAKSLGYTVGGIFVTLNGLTLRPGEDYTATTGTSIVLVSAATVGDELQVHAFNNFSVASVQASAVSYAPAGTGAVSTTVQAKLRESVSVMDFGADPSASSAANTTAFNSAIAAAISTNLPLLIPPVGVFNIRRLATVTGDLTIYSTDAGKAEVKVDGVNWPYTSGGEPVLTINGNFYTHDVTWNQNWTVGDSPGYRDDRNPTSWGGHWIVQANCTTGQTLSVVNCVLKNVYRGFLASAINPTLGGPKNVVFTGNRSEALNGPSQTLIAGDAPFNMTVSNNPLLETKQWNSGATYPGNGISFVIAWGGTNIKIDNNTLVGYQLVARGPRNVLWTPSTTFQAGEEYLNVDVTYKVVTTYTSGLTFGAVDIVNTITTFNPSTDISVCGNRIQSPIADTAIYGWLRAVINENIITDSGDMGIAASGCGDLIVSNNVVQRVRNGGIDLTGQGTVTCTGNVVVDIARASSGVFSRIDTLNPNVFASNGGFNLAAITVGLPTSNGVKNVVVTGNTCAFTTLPPLTDPGPNNGGLVRAQVLGIYNGVSSNTSAFGTMTVTGNRVEDYEADMRGFVVCVPTLRFYNSSYTGAPVAGEVFNSVDGTRFVLVASIGSGNLTFVRKFQGRTVPYGNQVFTGATSGSVLTVANLPQATFLLSTESGNYDYTSKYIGDSLANVVPGLSYFGAAVVDPASIASGAILGVTIPVANAVVGDFVLVSPSYQIAGLQMTAYISNTNEVTVILKNDTGAAINLGSGTWKAKVIKS